MYKLQFLSKEQSENMDRFKEGAGLNCDQFSNDDSRIKRGSAKWRECRYVLRVNLDKYNF